MMLYSFSSVAANLPVVATAITVSAFTARQNAMHAELDIVSPFCPPDRPPNAGTTVSKQMDIIYNYSDTFWRSGVTSFYRVDLEVAAVKST